MNVLYVGGSTVFSIFLLKGREYFWKKQKINVKRQKSKKSTENCTVQLSYECFIFPAVFMCFFSLVIFVHIEKTKNLLTPPLQYQSFWLKPDETNFSEYTAHNFG